MKDIFSWPVIKTALNKQLAERGETLEALQIGGLKLLKFLGEQYIHGPFPMTKALETAPRVGIMTPEVSVQSVDFLSLPWDSIWKLSATYFSTYNPLFPILDPRKYYSKTLPEITRNGFSDGNIASLIVLLVVALGQCALERSLGELLQGERGEGSGIRGNVLRRPPGLEIFNEAQRRMGLEMTHYTLEHVQMFSLAA